MQKEIEIFKTIHQNEINEVEEFIDGHPKSAFFHKPEYLYALQKTRGYEPLMLMARSKGKISGIAIGEISNEIDRLPYITRKTIFYAEPTYSTPEVLDVLLSAIAENSKGLFCQIRPFFELNAWEVALYEKYCFKPSNHLNAFINVTDVDLIYDGFEKDKKKGIRKAIEKYGIKIEEYDDVRKSVDDFYTIQSHLFKKKQHFIKKKDFFLNLIDESGGSAKIIFATYEGAPIAAQLFLISKNRLTAFYTATLTEHREKHAGDLLIWHLLQYCRQHSIKIFDFGGGGSPDKTYPPRDYKKRFGTEFNNVKRFTLAKSVFYNVIMSLYHKIKS